MARESLPLVVDDLSTFTKSLRTQLLAHPATPGHQTLLNMLARAAGHRNLQMLKARPPALPVRNTATSFAARCACSTIRAGCSGCPSSARCS